MKEIYIYELFRILKKPWFYLTSLILPILLLGGAGLPTILSKYILREMKEVKIAVIGEKDLGREIRSELLRIPFMNCELKEDSPAGFDKYSIVIEAREKEVIVRMKEKDMFKGSMIEKAIKNAYFAFLLTRRGFDRNEIEKIKEGIPVKILTTQKKEIGGRYFNLIIYIIFYAGVVGFGDFLARRITVDKESNFIDILLIYKKPSKIFWGKLLSVDTSYLVFLIITFSLSYLLLKLLPSYTPGFIFNLFFKQLDAKSIFIISFIFFLGFLMFSSFYLLAGGISNSEDSLKGYSTIINFLLLAGLLISSIFNPLPTFGVEKILFYIPPITPFLMLSWKLKRELDMFEFFMGSFLMIFTIIVFTKIASNKYEISSLYKKSG